MPWKNISIGNLLLVTCLIAISSCWLVDRFSIKELKEELRVEKELRHEYWRVSGPYDVAPSGEIDIDFYPLNEPLQTSMMVLHLGQQYKDSSDESFRKRTVRFARGLVELQNYKSRVGFYQSLDDSFDRYGVAVSDGQDQAFTEFLERVFDKNYSY